MSPPTPHLTKCENDGKIDVTMTDKYLPDPNLPLEEQTRRANISEARTPYQADVQANLPATLQPIVDPDIQDGDIVSMCATVAQLTNLQAKILMKLAENYLSDDTQTDADIARDMGIHKNTMGQFRRNPRAGRALTAVILALAGSKVDKYIAGIEKHGEKDWRAYELMLKVLGVYIPKQQSLNISAKMETEDSVGSFSDFIDEFCIKVGASGYPIQSVIERFQELKAEGAF